MKILHVIDSDGLYGAEKVLLSLMEIQAKEEEFPVLLSIGNMGVGTKRIESEARKRNLKVIEFRFHKSLILKGAKQIIKIAYEVGANIIHSHGYKPNIMLGLLPKQLRKVPVLSTLHGWTARRFFSKMSVYRLLDVLAMKRLDQVVAVTEAAKSYKILKLFNIHTNVIFNGIDTLNFKKGEFERDFPEFVDKFKDRFRIVYVGRLSPEKGCDILIKAVGYLVKKGCKIGMVFIGEGAMRKDLEELAKKMIPGDCTAFVGYRDKAYRYFPFFDLFVLPSYTEGFPITLLEAMQAGICILATNVGEIPKVLERGKLGVIVNPGSVLDLVSAISEIIKSSKLAAEKRILARKKALNEYSIFGMAKMYDREYRKLCGQA